MYPNKIGLAKLLSIRIFILAFGQGKEITESDQYNSNK